MREGNFGSPPGPERSHMTTYHADDVTNQPTGAVQGPSKPVTAHADWVPDDVEAKVVAAPEKTTVRKQSRASKK